MQLIGISSAVCAGLLLAGSLLPVNPGVQSPTPPWHQILASTKVSLPEPLPAVIWHENLAKAMELARAQGRPLFVTMRCLPCQQCSAFDADVLDGGESLDPLLRQFITVCLTDANATDLRIFPVAGYQDFDLSWWGWFLSERAELYGIFGGKDHVSDSTRISEAALVASLERVLAHHYDPRRQSWKIDGPEPELAGQPRRPQSWEGYASWAEKTPWMEQGSCIHCHQLGEILRQPALDAGTFNIERDLAIWPLPENLGITLQRDHGLRIDQVASDSPAAAAGLRAGDVLAAAGGRRLFGQADFRGVLHRGPGGDGQIGVHWLRSGELMSAPILVQEGWRKTEIYWRASISGGNIGPRTGFFPIPVQADERERYGIPAGTMAVHAYVGAKPQGTAFAAGLQPHAIIVAVNGKSPDLTGRAWRTWFRLNHEIGQEIVLTIATSKNRRNSIRFIASDRL